MKGFAKTAVIKAAVEGQEERVLDTVVPDWRRGHPHITCPYPAHGGASDWRWDVKKRRAFCTCIEGSHSVFDVIMVCECLDFEAAKIRAAELIGRADLIQPGDETPGSRRFLSTSPRDLLDPPRFLRDDQLVHAYLAHRLGVEHGAVVMPVTPVAGITALAYFDSPPPGRRNGGPKKVGDYPCAVFGTLGSDGRRHAHRIYVAPGGAGKAELGVTADGSARDPKKSAKAAEGDNTSGRAVLWGDGLSVPWLILAEGIETGAAIALAFRSEIEAGACAVASAISAVGVEAFRGWPATTRITVAADRDEAPKPGRPEAKQRRGEKAARLFGVRQHEILEVSIALPGRSGEDLDWLDVLVAEGPEAVHSGILTAEPFVPVRSELEARCREVDRASELAEIANLYPLPALSNLSLVYAHAAASNRVMVHKRTVESRKEILTAIASPFGMPARLRYVGQADAYGLRIVVQDMSGSPRTVDVDRSNFARNGAAETRALLFGAGLRIEDEGEHIVVQCLKAADPEREILVISQPGWHEIEGVEVPLFICPDGSVIGAPAGPSVFELASSARMTATVARGGSIEDWRAAVEAALSQEDCPHWTIGTVAAFVGPLVALMGLDSCGLNLSGMSSSGKTTAQRLAASAWSKPVAMYRDSLFQTAKATVNSMESMAARATGTVLVLDEMAHVSGKEVERLIYGLAGGVGKRRMAADATVRDGYFWQTFAILSGECSLEEKVRSDEGTWLAGMATRFVDVDVTGVSRTISGEELAAISAVETNHGHAGPAFVEALVREGLHRSPARLREGVMQLARRLAGPGSDSAKNRAAIPFALLITAGELAMAFDVLPQWAAVRSSAEWAWQRFMQSSDANALDPPSQVIANLRTWVAQRWESKIRSVDDLAGARSAEAVGWYDGARVFIPRGKLREAAGAVLTEKATAEILRDHDLLANTKDAHRLYVDYVPKIGKGVEAYALKRPEFGRTEPDTETTRFRTFSHEGG